MLSIARSWRSNRFGLASNDSTRKLRLAHRHTRRNAQLIGSGVRTCALPVVAIRAGSMGQRPHLANFSGLEPSTAAHGVLGKATKPPSNGLAERNKCLTYLSKSLRVAQIDTWPFPWMHAEDYTSESEPVKSLNDGLAEVIDEFFQAC
jgi:hypothetical protein